jgi:hypothetical protein
MRRRVMRRALAGLAAAVAATAPAGCGGGGGTASSTTDVQGDAVMLNQVLSRQAGAVAAYGGVLGGLSGRDLAIARRFRAQEQEHVDAIVKALRGLGAKAEFEPEAIDLGDLKTRADRLTFLYRLEAATIELELGAIANLTTAAPRTLLAATVADQAQHLALLRQALGVKPLGSVPEAFENGTAPAP